MKRRVKNNLKDPVTITAYKEDRDGDPHLVGEYSIEPGKFGRVESLTESYWLAISVRKNSGCTVELHRGQELLFVTIQPVSHSGPNLTTIVKISGKDQPGRGKNEEKDKDDDDVEINPPHGEPLI